MHSPYKKNMSTFRAAKQLTYFVAKKVEFLFWRHVLVAFLRGIVVFSKEEIYVFFSFLENKFSSQESCFQVTGQESYLFFIKKTFLG